jgi:protein TonB
MRRNEIVLALCIAAMAWPFTSAARAGDEPTGAQAGVATAEQGRQKPVDIQAVDVMPKLVKQVPPRYPEKARRRGQEGIVQISALVKTDGTTDQVRVVPGKGLAPDLDRAAIEAIRQWTFEPARLKDKPVAVYIVVPVKFNLK